MLEIKPAIKEFLFYCNFEKNLSQKSIKSYKTDLKQFNEFLNDEKIQDCEKIKKETIRKYIKKIENIYKPKSIKRKIAVIKALFNFLEYEHDLMYNPFRKMRIRITDPETIPTFMEISEVKQFFQTVYNELKCTHFMTKYKKRVILRDIAILELLFAAGIRVSELCNIRESDINLDSGLIHINGKGNKKRLISINTDETRYALKEYFKAFSSVKKKCSFFLSTNLETVPQSNLLG